MYLEDNPNFNTFVSLAKFSGLYAEMHVAKSITVMALPNEVFHAMEAGVYSQLINQQRDTIKRMIACHIVSNKYKTNCLIHGSRIQAMNGSELVVYNKNGVLRINNALVTKADIRLKNGVVHIIDALLQGFNTTHSLYLTNG